jgi:hypothetical protein
MTTLYIATHNKTQLKYFGQTSKYFTQEELQKYYHGSGKYWKSHLKKHGDDVSMEIFGIFEDDEVEEIALQFSSKNNISESDKWANLMPENGKGIVFTEEMKQKISKTLSGRKRPQELKEKLRKANIGKEIPDNVRKKISKTLSGRKRPNISKSTKEYLKKAGIKSTSQKRIKVFDKNGKEVLESFGTFELDCKQFNFPFAALKKSYQNSGSPIFQRNNGKIPKSTFKKYQGWYAKIIS